MFTKIEDMLNFTMKILPHLIFDTENGDYVHMTAAVTCEITIP